MKLFYVIIVEENISGEFDFKNKIFFVVYLCLVVCRIL